MWQDFFAAVALLLVIEGIMPFLNPLGYQKTMRKIQDLDAKALRSMGLASMILGLVLLLLVR